MTGYLGDYVDSSKKITIEIGNLLYGNIVNGNLTQLEHFELSEPISLDDLYQKYANKIKENELMYFVETGGLSGNIYVCGNYEQGKWSLFANTSGYA